MKRQGQSAKNTNEQIQKKLTENGIHRDDSSKNFPVTKLPFLSDLFTGFSVFSYYRRENEHRSRRLLRVNVVK